MNRTLLASLAVFLMACEGEPPVMASAPVGPGPAPGVAIDDTAADPTATTPATPLPACACTCNGCGGVASVVVDGGASGEAGSAPVASAAPNTPPAPVPASISGNVTTLPKSAAAAAVVYLDGLPVEPTAKMTTTISNRMMTFIPYVSVVPVGGKGIFRNDDPFPHNVFSPDNERFTLGMIPQRAAAVRSFKTPGYYTLLCNLHPGMLGYLVVTPSSYYAKADAHGHYSIKNVPPGTYKITAWAPRQQPVTQPVTVKEGDIAVDFDIHR